MFTGITELKQRLRNWILRHWPGVCHYIGGAQVLPPPLEREEEKEVFARLSQGDASARRTLIEHNLRLVVYIARKFETSGIGMEDLISIGTIGLIKAVNTFCPEKNIKLATYASRCIENEILMVLRKTQNQRSEISIDEPLRVDWDGNEMMLSDILGTDPDIISRPIERSAEQAMLLGGGSALGPGTADHASPVWAARRNRAHPEGGRRCHWDLAILHLPVGKAHSGAAAPGAARPVTENTSAFQWECRGVLAFIRLQFLQWVPGGSILRRRGLSGAVHARLGRQHWQLPSASGPVFWG